MSSLSDRTLRRLAWAAFWVMPLAVAIAIPAEGPSFGMAPAGM